MAEYYDYVAESANDQINWGEIGKNISDMLNKQVEQRDQRREEINTATNDIVKTLNDTTILGQDQNANAWWQEGAGQLQDYLLMQNRLWKNGQLDNVTYKRNIENTKNNTDQLINIFNNYNKLNDARVKKAQEGGISGQGMFVHDNLSQYANLNNTKLYINPSDGNMVLSQKVDKNGQIVADNNPNGIKTISALTSAMSTEYNTYDLDKALEKPVKDFGTMMLTQIGGLEGYSNPEDVMSKIKDIRKNPSFQQSKEAIINKIMLTNDYVSSIYSDIVNSGVDFKNLFTYDPNDKDPNKVLLKLNANGRYEADFSGEKGEQQKTKVRNAISNRLDTMLDKEVTTTFDPLLARAEYEQKTAAGRAAELEAKRKAKEQEQSDNTQKDYYNQLIPISETRTDPDTGKVIQVEKTPTVSQYLNEELKKPDADLRTAVSRIMGSIKKDGKSFQGFNVKDTTIEASDGTKRHGMIISLPDGYIKDNVAITVPTPQDEIGNRQFEQMVANLFNIVVTNNKNVDASRIIGYEKIPFEWKNPTSASQFNY